MIDRDIDRAAVTRIEAAYKALCPRQKTVDRQALVRILCDCEAEGTAIARPNPEHALAVDSARDK